MLVQPLLPCYSCCTADYLLDAPATKQYGCTAHMPAVTRFVCVVQVGSFFEAAGMDAVLLAEHCGLKFMGGNLSAGFQAPSIHQYLDQLVQKNGFDVVSV